MHKNLLLSEQSNGGTKGKEFWHSYNTTYFILFSYASIVCWSSVEVHYMLQVSKIFVLHCGKRFSNRRNLHYHLKVHDGTKDFKCSNCDQRFVYPSCLKVHYMRMHAGLKERRFERIFCTKTFVTGADIERHLRSRLRENSVHL